MFHHKSNNIDLYYKNNVLIDKEIVGLIKINMPTNFICRDYKLQSLTNPLQNVV